MVCLHAVQGNGRPYWRKGKSGECALGFALFWGVERDFFSRNPSFRPTGLPLGERSKRSHTR